MTNADHNRVRFSNSRSFTTGTGNSGTSATGLVRRVQSWHRIHDDFDDDSDDDSFFNSSPSAPRSFCEENLECSSSSDLNNNHQLATTKTQPSVTHLVRAVKLGCRYLVRIFIVGLALLQLTTSLSTWKTKMGLGNTLDVEERPLVSASGDWPTAGAGGVRGALPASASKSVGTNEKKQDRVLGVASSVISSSSSSSVAPSLQHRLVGIVLDASAIEDNILNFLVDIACRHNVMSHVLSSKGVSEASSAVRILMEEKYSSKSSESAEQCAEIVFATEPPQLIAGIDNRIDRISRLRDYQRDMLMTDGDISPIDGGSSNSNGVVIVADLDLHKLPAVEKVMQEVDYAIHSGDGADVVCAAGIMHRPFGYYDTFATVLLPNTFVYPVSGRFDESIHEDEERQFIVSSGGSFSQEDLLRHFEQISQEEFGGRPVPVRSCFGGLAIYKSEVWHEPKCRYSSWQDQCSPDAVRYANIEDGRACEHVTFHACLREHRKDLAIAVQPKFMPMWDSSAQSLSSSLRSGEHLLTVHSDTKKDNGSRGGGDFNSAESGHQLDHDHLSSSDSRYRMRIHPATGNVFLEEMGATSPGDNKVIWSAFDNSNATSSTSTTNTPYTEWMNMRHAIQSVLVLRDDGRLVLEREVHNTAQQICNPSDMACRFEVWSSTTSAIGDGSGSNKNSFLHLSDQGTLTLQDRDSGEFLWSATQEDTWSECPSYIPSGFQLHEGDILCSPGDTYHSGIDSNGFFVLRNDATAKNEKAYFPLTGLDEIASDLSSSTMTAHIQGDGNLVVHSLSNDGEDRDIVLWSSNSAFPGSEGSHVALHDDGVLRIVTRMGVVLRELVPKGPSPACPTILPSGGRLEVGEHLCSHSAAAPSSNVPMYKFGLSSSGFPELVVTKEVEQSQVVWVASVNLTSTNTSLTLQDDGNLVLYDENAVALWSSNTAAFGAVVSFSTDGGLQMITPDGSVVALLSETSDEFERPQTERVILESNGALVPGEIICSPSGNFCFGLDADKDQLCLWKVAGEDNSASSTSLTPDKDCIWSKTFQDIDEFSTSSLIMQGDGNLVLVADGGSDRTLHWSSESHGRANEDSYLVIRDYGAAEIVNKKGITTFSIAGSDVCPRWLLGGQSLRNDGEFICSADSRYRLGLGSDSNLAIYDLRSQEKVWETRTCCDDVSALLQADANFIVRGSFDDLWSTDATTNSTSGVALRLSNNGDAEILDMDGSLVWSSAAAKDDNNRILRAASTLPGCDAINFRPEDDDFRTFALPKRFTKHHRIVIMSESFASTKRNRVLSHRWDFGDAPQIHHKKIKAQDNVPPASLGDDTNTTEQCDYDGWQSRSYLTCNSVHESTAFRETTTFLGQGANNQGWAMSSSSSSPGVTDEFVLKRQVVHNTFSPKYYERARLESLVMQRMTSSRRILDTYGYCGTSIMNQKGWREMSSLGIEQQIISPKQMLQYGLGVSQALADLHEGGILHTDLSASNVLIGPEMEVILHDFDQAALLTHEEGSTSSCGVRMHDEKCDHYRSPEKCHFDNQVLTTKSDVYGLGGLLYFLLSGATPYSFPEIDDLEVVRSKIRSGTLPQYPLHIELSKSKAITSLREIAHQCLQYEPENRPGAREVANLIEAAFLDYDEEEEKESSNEILAPGSVLDGKSSHLQSSNSSHTFGFDPATGDLSIWHHDQIIWSLGLCCQGDDKFATFNFDGNFVVENGGGVIYDTGTDYGGQWVGAIMFVDDDGKVKLKNYHGYETILFDPYSRFLRRGEMLNQTSERLNSEESNHTFGFDPATGDLSIWHHDQIIWSLGLCCQGDDKFATFNFDGNFVVENGGGVIYDTGTDYGGQWVGAIMFVDDDGKVKLKNYHGNETILFDPYSRFLRRGEMLNQTSERLNSEESNHTFGFDPATGALSIWHHDQIIWSLGLCCQGDDKFATFNFDGNFVVENGGGVIYDTGTDYGGQWVGAIMFVDDDGKVKLKNYHGNETILFDPYSRFLRRGEMLNQTSERLNSEESNHTFGFDPATGDLSIWHHDQIIWSLGLCCQGDDKFATFTSEGNFVVENGGGVIYDTGTDYGGQWVGAIMFVDDDGKVKLKNHLGQETIVFGPSESNTGTSNFNELSSEPWFPPAIVDSSTMHGRVFTGYQGWFTTPCDDGLKRWHHWSDRSRPDNETLTIDMWPDLDEYDEDELCDTDLSYEDGTKASVFSSYNPKTVDRHIRWMSEYDIDGPFVQRFVTDIKVFRHMRDHVLKLVQASSERYGRVFSNMYDLTGAEKGIQTMEDIKRDWKFLVDGLKITESSRYLNHKGRPVLGLFFGKPSKSPLSATEALELIDWLQNHDEERYRVTVIVGGLEKSWRSDPDEQWMPVFNQADVISPWTIGRYFDQKSVDHHGKRYLIPDVNHCHENNQDYLPVVFPGFSAKNIMPGKPLNEIPRNGGQFLWRQLLHAFRSKANMIFVAMFDEVDEGTAIFKTATTASRAPSNTDFVTLDIDEDKSHETNLPSDFYLQLVGEAKRLLSEGAEFPYTYEYLSRSQGEDNGTSKDRNGWNDVLHLSDPSDLAPCGAHKCFFLSASNPNRTGYLVQQGDPFRRSENLQSQYESTMYLESNYGTRHFLLGPPTSVDVSDSLVSQLNEQVDRRHKYSAMEPIVVQKVKVAPKQSMIMLGCHLDRQPQVRDDIQNFLQSNVDNITEFSLQFEREVSSTIQVMEMEPWFARDWQAMVDRHGHLYSIDIAPKLGSTDGKGDKLGYTTLDWIDLCYEMFQDFVQVATERAAHHSGGDFIVAASNTSFHSLRGGKDFDLLALDPTNDCAASVCTVASADNSYVGYEVTNMESPKLTERWEVARTLTNKYLIHHNVLGRPVPINTTSEALLANIQAHPGEGTVLVQKVLRKLPLESFLFSCDPSVEDGDQLEKGRLSNFVQDSVPDRAKFLKRLRNDANLILTMARNEQKKNQRGLPRHVRAMIDAKGKIYLTGLHRYATTAEGQNSNLESYKKCLGVLANFKLS